jgi:hypothetical protein
LPPVEHWHDYLGEGLNRGSTGPAFGRPVTRNVGHLVVAIAQELHQLPQRSALWHTVHLSNHLPGEAMSSTLDLIPGPEALAKLKAEFR